jgi:hypothetical protein
MLEHCDVRIAATEELDVVRQLRHEVLDPVRSYPIELEGDALDVWPSIVTVGLHEGEIGATVRAVPLTPVLFKIGKVAVHDRFKGTRLIDATFLEAETRAIECGAEKFTLDSRPGRAYNFHRRMGYRDMGVMVLQPFGVLNHVMEKEAV